MNFFLLFRVQQKKDFEEERGENAPLPETVAHFEPVGVQALIKSHISQHPLSRNWWLSAIILGSTLNRPKDGAEERAVHRALRLLKSNEAHRV